MSKCLQNFENFLLNYYVLSFIAWLLYFPFLHILLLIHFLEMLLNGILHFIYRQIRKLLCCLTAKCEPKYEPVTIEVSDSTETGSVSLSILTYNVFFYFGRFRTRQYLLDNILYDANPDIFCINEGISTSYFDFGTVCQLKRIIKNAKANFVAVRPFDFFLEDYLFNHCLFLYKYIIGEIQVFLNVYFFVPCVAKFFFKQGEKESIFFKAWGVFVSGILNQFCNIILFKKRKMFYSETIGLPQFATAACALYIEKNKYIWVVHTHLSTNAVNCFDKDIRTIQIEKILNWIDTIINEKFGGKCDCIVITGDLNSSPQERVYSTLVDAGYVSCMCQTYGVGNYYTFHNKTWTFAAEFDCDYKHDTLIFDYIWVKAPRNNVKIESCKVVGQTNYINCRHLKEQVRVYPSDHSGILVRLKID